MYNGWNIFLKNYNILYSKYMYINYFNLLSHLMGRFIDTIISLELKFYRGWVRAWHNINIYVSSVLQTMRMQILNIEIYKWTWTTFNIKMDYNFYFNLDQQLSLQNNFNTYIQNIYMQVFSLYYIYFCKCSHLSRISKKVTYTNNEANCY